MTCDNCIFKRIHLGSGAPDDYSMEYCAKGHWEGGPIDEVIEEDVWVNCNDYTQEKQTKMETKEPIQRYLFEFSHKDEKITVYECQEYGEGAGRHRGCTKVAMLTFEADIPSQRSGGGGSPYYDYNNNIHLVSGYLDESAFDQLVEKFLNWCDISNGFIWVNK